MQYDDSEVFEQNAVPGENAGLEQLIGHAETQLFLGETENAKAYFLKATREFPEDWRSWFGMVRFYTGNFTDCAVPERRYENHLVRARAAASAQELIQLEAEYEHYLQKRTVHTAQETKREEVKKASGGFRYEFEQEMKQKSAKRKKVVKKSGIIASIVAGAAVVMLAATLLVLYLTEEMRFEAGRARINTYTVTYHYLDGSGGETEKTDTFVFGKTTPKPPEVREGYVFAWYTSPDCNKESRYFFDKRPNEVITEWLGEKSFELWTKWIALYKIQFWTMGGNEEIDSVECEDGTVFDMSAYKPTKQGVDFRGWCTDEDFVVNVGNAITVTQNLNMFAKWSTLCTVTYNTNGGTYVAPISRYDGDVVYRLSPQLEPLKTNARFGGWYLDAELTVPAVFPLVLEKSITLHAKWLARYTITFDVDGGGYVLPFYAYENEPITQLADTWKYEGTFGGWYKDKALTQPVTYPLVVTENTTLYAKWLARYTVTLKMFELPDAFITVDEGAAAVLPYDTFRYGYRIAGWYTDEGLTQAAPVPFKPTQNTALYAKWAPKEQIGAVDWLKPDAAVCWEFTAALDAGGGLWALGRNAQGQLGDGTRVDKDAPVAIKAELKFQAVSAGKEHCLAIDLSGGLWAWGNGGNGRLGNGSNTGSNIPVQIMPGTKFKEVSAGESHSLAIDLSGGLWAWGNGGNGRLGNGSNTGSNIPVQLLAGTKFKSVSAGDQHSLAIDESGGLWAWGNNGEGRLGDGSNTARNAPVAIKPDMKFIAVSAGTSHSLAVDAYGGLWAWGNNGEGRLGDGSSGGQRSSPVLIRPDLTFAAVSAGDQHSLAIDINGGLWAWGYNNRYQLGDGTTMNRNTPVRIEAESGQGINFVSACAGYRHSIAADADGNWWVWGDVLETNENQKFRRVPTLLTLP